MIKKNIGLLGNGEVGKAIGKFYVGKNNCQVYVEEIDTSDFPDKLDILHVCIPYSDNFIDIVKVHIDNYKPLVIIHSSVPVGTTEKLEYKFAVHSPVRGVHPNLYDGIKTFVKYIGADFAGAGRLVAEHFEEIGMIPQIVHKSKTTELAKLLSTTYYATCIAFHSYANKLCEKENLSFEAVMTEWNNSYNVGYMKLGKPEVIRPILYLPENDVIGGHCQIPNAKLLEKQYGHDYLLDSILRHTK